MIEWKVNAEYLATDKKEIGEFHGKNSAFITVKQESLYTTIVICNIFVTQILYKKYKDWSKQILWVTNSIFLFLYVEVTTKQP